MTVKQILYSLQNCSLGQSAARAPTPATPHHPQFPHKMRRRHLESVSAAPYGRCFASSVSSRSLAKRGSWGTAPSVFWYGAPGGTQGPLGKGGVAERWRVAYPIGIATRHGAKPATTRTHKRNAPPARRTGRHPAVTPRRRHATTNSHNKSQSHSPNKIHYLCDLRPVFPHIVNFPLKKVKY